MPSSIRYHRRALNSITETRESLGCHSVLVSSSQGPILATSAVWLMTCLLRLKTPSGSQLIRNSNVAICITCPCCAYRNPEASAPSGCESLSKLPSPIDQSISGHRIGPWPNQTTRRHHHPRLLHPPAERRSAHRRPVRAVGPARFAATCSRPAFHAPNANWMASTVLSKPARSGVGRMSLSRRRHRWATS